MPYLLQMTFLRFDISICKVLL